MKTIIRKIQLKSVSLSALTLFLGFVLCFASTTQGAKAQSKDEVVTQLLQNDWVKKFRRIKTDMESKAGNLKDAKNEEELARLKDDYMRTRSMMEKWVESLSEELRKENTLSNMLQTPNYLPENLKEELETLYAFYEDNFNTTYEQIVGVNQKNPVVNFAISSSDDQKMFSSYSSSNFDSMNLKKDLAKVLEPNTWKAIY